jgi:small-conductance mechanosensitive channel
MDGLPDQLVDILSSIGVATAVILILVGVYLFLERQKQPDDGKKFRNQMIMIALTLAGVLAIILVLPISEHLRGQLLSFLGILLSAAIALSSTTFLGNALAGVMLRVVRNFRMGDFIRVGEHFGRVSERGLFHTEIQTEERELVTLPNLHLVTQPVTTIRSSGTIISATLSLGYDVPHTRIEELLLQGAKEAGLEEPFVLTMELGDFSVTYRVAGLLTEVKQYISARSRLRTCAMDALHRGGVEIVSPTFMNTRAFAEDRQFIPKVSRVVAAAPTTSAPEEVVFDKAEEAESLEAMGLRHAKLLEEIKALEEEAKKATEESEKGKLEKRVEQIKTRADRLAAAIEERKAAASSAD